MEHRRDVVDIAQRVSGHTAEVGMLGSIPSMWLEQHENDHLEASAFMVAMLIRSGAPVTDGILDQLVDFIQENDAAISAGGHIALEDFHVFSFPGSCGIAAPGIDTDMPSEDVANATAAIAELMSRAFASSSAASASAAPQALVRFLHILADQQQRMAAMQAILDADAETPPTQDEELEVEPA